MKSKEKKNGKNKKNLTFQIAWKLIVIIILVLACTASFSLYTTAENIASTFEEDTKELVRETSFAINCQNSMHMQQLRSYTALNFVGRSSRDPLEIHEMLKDFSKNRGNSFKAIAYADYETELAYYDDGSIKSVSNEDWFRKMKDNKLDQLYAEPIGDSFENGLIPYCKTSIVKDDLGNAPGFFVGFAPIIDLQKTVMNIKGKDIASPKGFAVIVDSKGYYIAGPATDTILKFPCWTHQMSKYADDAIDFIKNTDGKKILHSTLISGNMKNEIFLHRVASTTWSAIIVVPTSTVQKTQRELMQSLLLTIIITALVMSVFASLLIYHYIKPLKKVNANLKEISTGNADLTKRLPEMSSNEIGQVTHNFNTFVARLQVLITDISKSKDNMLNANEEVTKNLGETHENILHLDNSVEDTENQMGKQISSVEDSRNIISDISEKISNLDTLINQQSNAVEEASSAVEEMIGNIKSVTKSTVHMSNTFSTLTDLSEKGTKAQKEIQSIVSEMSEKSKDLDVANKTIANIASETNLLAMNAAIEAAHAGDAGRGFAVVADEIRTLAESSSVQSKEIKDKISDIKALIDKVVGAASQADSIYQTTNSEMANTSQIVSTIKNAMDEQDVGSQQIIDVLKQMREVSLGVSEAGVKMQKSQEELQMLTSELTNSTSQMKNSLEQTSISAKSVKDMETKVLTAAEEVNDAIGEISDQINGFKI